MVSVSCFYIHYNREPLNFIFIKYEKFIKILLNNKSIILSINELISYRELFNIYIISLLLTEDTSKINSEIIDKKKYYGISTIKYWKNIRLTSYYTTIFLERYSHKNPLNTLEPKRSTSFKKINKFMKIFYEYYDNEYIINPIELINEYYFKETELKI